MTVYCVSFVKLVWSGSVGDIHTHMQEYVKIQLALHSKNGYVMQNASLEFFVEVTQKFVILTVILM